MLTIERIDHFVLTVQDVEASARFYNRVLGFKIERFGPLNSQGEPSHWAVSFGRSKINLHPAVGNTIDIVAEKPIVGAGDFCLITETPLAEAMAHIQAQGVAIEKGPIERTGAMGTLTSIYFRDLDGNLVEVSTYG